MEGCISRIGTTSLITILSRGSPLRKTCFLLISYARSLLGQDPQAILIRASASGADSVKNRIAGDQHKTGGFSQ